MKFTFLCIAWLVVHRAASQQVCSNPPCNADDLMTEVSLLQTHVVMQAPQDEQRLKAREEELQKRKQQAIAKEDFAAAGELKQELEGVEAQLKKLAESKPDLPPGWSSAYDKTYGRTYYFKIGSKESQWDKPEMNTEKPEKNTKKPVTNTVSLPQSLPYISKAGRGGCRTSDLLFNGNGFKSEQSVQDKCDELHCAFYAWSDDADDLGGGAWFCRTDIFAGVTNGEYWPKWRVGHPNVEKAFCYHRDHSYDGELSGQVRSVEESASACQQRCAGVSGCAHFSFWDDGGCHLQDKDAAQVRAPGATSGKPTCEAVPYHFADKGANTCPDASVRLPTPEECMNAGAALGLSSFISVNNPFDPAGCFKCDPPSCGENTPYFWNSHPEGNAHEDRSPICVAKQEANLIAMPMPSPMVEAQPKATPYHFGDSGSNDCPESSVRLTTKEECRKSGSALGLSIFVPVSADSDPAGCFKCDPPTCGPVTPYFWNDNPSGKAKENRSPICAKKDQRVCHTADFRYDPDLFGQGRSVETSAVACQRRCSGISGCAHFAFWNDGGCHLQGEDATQLAESGVTSGPPTCEANARAVPTPSPQLHAEPAKATTLTCEHIFTPADCNGGCRWDTFAGECTQKATPSTEPEPELKKEAPSPEPKPEQEAMFSFRCPASITNCQENACNRAGNTCGHCLDGHFWDIDTCKADESAASTPSSKSEAEQKADATVEAAAAAAAAAAADPAAAAAASAEAKHKADATVATPSPNPEAEEKADCPKWTTTGWHSGLYMKVFASWDAPDGNDWTWQQCAAQCAMYDGCEFWTLQLTESKDCIMMADKGEYNDVTDHVEGPKDYNCKDARVQMEHEDDKESKQVPGYSYHGTGFCDGGYYAGWDASEAQDLEECAAKCTSEVGCHYFSLKLGVTCSRYGRSAGKCDSRKASKDGLFDQMTYKNLKAFETDRQTMDFSQDDPGSVPRLARQAVQHSVCNKDLLGWFQKNYGDHTPLKVVDIGGGKSGIGSGLPLVVKKLKYNCYDTVASPICKSFATLATSSVTDANVVLFNSALHHTGDATISLLESAAKMARDYVVIQEDLRARNFAEGRRNFFHQWGGAYRGDVEWRALFRLLDFEVVHHEKACKERTDVGRLLYVLKKREPQAKACDEAHPSEVSLLQTQMKIEAPEDDSKDGQASAADPKEKPVKASLPERHIYESKVGRAGCRPSDLLLNDAGFADEQSVQDKCDELRCSFYAWSDDEDEARGSAWFCRTDQFENVANGAYWPKWKVGHHKTGKAYVFGDKGYDRCPESSVRVPTRQLCMFAGTSLRLTNFQAVSSPSEPAGCFKCEPDACGEGVAYYWNDDPEGSDHEDRSPICMKEPEKAPEYHFAERGENSCPDSSVRVETKEECSNAGKALGLTEFVTIKNPSDPAGCYKCDPPSCGVETPYFWNEHPEGKGHEDRSPICTKKATEATKNVKAHKNDVNASEITVPAYLAQEKHQSTCNIELLGWFQKTFGSHTPLNMVDVGGGKSAIGSAIKAVVNDIKYKCYDLVSTSNCESFDGAETPSVADANVVLFNGVLHHMADSTISLLESAAKVTNEYVVIQEDLRAKNFAEGRRNFFDEWGGNYRGDKEWRELFRLLNFEVVHSEKVCTDRIDVGRAMYVLKKGAPKAQDCE